MDRGQFAFRVAEEVGKVFQWSPQRGLGKRLQAFWLAEGLREAPMDCGQFAFRVT